MFIVSLAEINQSGIREENSSSNDNNIINRDRFLDFHLLFNLLF